MDKVVQALRARRRAEGLTQRAVAHGVGCSQPYLSQVERGRRPLSEKMALRLEEFLECPGLFTTAPFLKGRPPMTDTSKVIRRSLIQGAVAPTDPPPDLGRRPRHSQVHQKWGVEDRLSGLTTVFREETGDMLERLEKEKGPDQRYWRNFNSLRFDSWCERWFLLALALLGAQLTGVRLSAMGCALAVVNGKSGKEFKGCHRGFLMQHQGVSIAWVPQVAVRTRAMYRCPDNVLLISKGDKTVTAVVEVVGGEYHTLDELVERAYELGVPFYALDAGWVGDPRVFPMILDWAVSLVA
ncbi:MAG: helix-turn-helix transcriptional regulator [Candidatus Eremiobacteraeota bacterium]|nr:helix-turn-helix transcriptional regulator [Candidatus Eremiobacteraeota bacterium]